MEAKTILRRMALVAVLVGIGTLSVAQESEEGTAPAPKARHTLSGRIKRTDAESVKTTVSPLSPLVLATQANAITADRGYLFLLVGRNVYKLDEKDLHVVQVRSLDTPSKPAPSKHSKVAPKKPRARIKKAAKPVVDED